MLCKILSYYLFAAVHRKFNTTMEQIQEETYVNLFKLNVDHFLKSLDDGSRTAPQWFKKIHQALSKFATDTINVVSELEGSLGVQKAVTDALANNKTMLEKHLEELEGELEEMQQYSRRTNILIHGVEEKPNEDTDAAAMEIITEKLEVPCIDMDISRSHRLGKKVAEKTRPIIVRLARYNVKKNIYDAKKKLKGTGTVITENLTPARYDLYKQCKEKFGLRNVYTLDGRIYRLTGKNLPNGKPERLIIRSVADL